MKVSRRVMLYSTLLATALAGAAFARPASWFKWRSKVDGALVCAQVPLGPGWEKASGPYQDSHCEKRSPHE